MVRVFLLWVTAFFSVFFTGFESGEINIANNVSGFHQDCPDPFVNWFGQCILKGDAVLDHTLEVPPYAHLNCRGHTLSPDPEDPPQLAMFLNGAYGAQIKNCIITGFEYGVLAVNTKFSQKFKYLWWLIPWHQIRILHNTVEADNVPIHLVSVDHALIIKNKISHSRKGGVGILLRFNSDFNKVINNEIYSDFSDDLTAVTRFPGPVIPPSPGPPMVVTSSNPNFNAGAGVSGSAILITETEGPEPTVYTSIINGALYQFSSSQSLEVNEEFCADNLVEGNAITLSHENRAMAGGILMPSSLRNTLRGNSITALSAVQSAIRDGLINNFTNSRQFPGSCELEPSRLCVGAGDCNLIGFDSESKGSCIGKPALPPDLLWAAKDILIEGNSVEGSFSFAGVNMGGLDMVARYNRVKGPFVSPGAGLVIQGKFSVETASFTRNIVTDVQNAIRVNQGFQGLTASAFLAEVRLNDFTGYDTAILTSVGYNLPSDLSGNYWGLSCEAGGFDPNLVLDLNGTPVNDLDVLVLDSQPYEEAVAKTPAKDLPSTCQN